MELIAIFLLVSFIICLFALYTSISWGFVAYKTYYWFILPLSTVLPQLTLFQMVGIVIFVSILTNKKSTTKYKNLEEEKTEKFLNFILAPWLVLLMSYVVYLYIK